MPVFSGAHGLKTTASSQQAADGVADFGNRLLAFSSKAEAIVAVADDDPDCPLAQACAAMLHASADTRAGLRSAQGYLERARAITDAATPREQAICAGAQAWCAGQTARAARIFEQVIDEHPGDIVSAKLAQGLHFDCGDSPGILRAPSKVARLCDDNAHLHGMMAFGYEECHLLNEAESAVGRALKIDRTEAWAHHAMAHISEARNTLSDGIDFMMAHADTWRGLTSFMYTHNWWHICLFLIDLDRGDEALKIFDSKVWAQNKDCVQDQINAISLLYRLERTGTGVGNRWQDVAAKVAGNARDQISVFLDLQFLYATARTNGNQGRAMLGRMLERAAAARDDESIAWREVAVVAAPGVLALAVGEFEKAARALRQARPSLQAIGGSHAQRDMITLFYIDALRGAGHWQKVQQLLAGRHNARPGVPWITSQLREAYHNLGLPDALGAGT